MAQAYDGASCSSDADAAHFLAQRPDTGCADPAGGPFCYELTAVDVHGNESAVASVMPQGALDVAGNAPGPALAAQSPNPSRAQAQ